MSDLSDRRGFLRQLMRTGARGAQEAAAVVVPGAASMRQLLDGIATSPALRDPEAELALVEPEAPAIAAPARAIARQPSRTVTTEELGERLTLAGLDPHRDAIVALARTSWRMTPCASAEADALIGDGDDIPPTGPSWAGEPLALVAQIDLSSPSVAAHPLAGPDRRLLLHFDTRRVPSGLSPGCAGAWSAELVSPDAAPGADLQPHRLDGELVLPRVWADPVQTLGLSPEGLEAYREVRDWLAETQDVEIDPDDGAGVAYHRLSGYPNDTTGNMPTACVATANGLEKEAWPHPDNIRIEAGQWLLLAQITLERHRLFFWIHQADLRAERFDRVWGFAR